jgi:Basic region leucine zipper
MLDPDLLPSSGSLGAWLGSPMTSFRTQPLPPAPAGSALAHAQPSSLPRRTQLSPPASESAKKNGTESKATDRPVRGSKSSGQCTPMRRRSNRAAQARYRDKRKAQGAELEAQVAVLTTEIASLEGVREENARLRDALTRAQERSAAAAAASAAGNAADEAVAAASTCTGSAASAITAQGQNGDAMGKTAWAQRANDVAAYDDVVTNQVVIRSRLQHVLEAAGVSVAAVTCASGMAALCTRDPSPAARCPLLEPHALL